MRHIAAAAALCLLIAATTASAAPIANQTGVRGVNGSGLTDAPPGNPFTLDFRPVITEATVPYTTLQVSLIFEAVGTQFSTFNIQLDAGPEVYSFLPYPGNQRQVAYTLYDPAFNPNPGPGYPTTGVFVLLPDAWRDEFRDGILSGRLWVTNPTGSTGNYIFAVSGAFAVPEPSVPEPSAALGLATMTGALLLRRRRKRVGRAAGISAPSTAA
jgi:hypothetical protein